MKTNGTGSTTIWQLVKERRTRDALYHAKEYWDARTDARSGLARSLWPSNNYNELWHTRQIELLGRNVGPFFGRHVVEIGCGTGRMVRHLIHEGAKEVLGIDFSRASIEAARAETTQLFGQSLPPQVRFEMGNVTTPFSQIAAGGFDDAITVSCLAVACSTRDSLSRALANIARLVRLGGRVILLEPIHTFPLLRRVLPFGVEEWIALANKAGLHLLKSDRMGFVPVRAVMSVREFPRPLMRVAFEAGEKLLDRAPYLPLADYTLLVFQKTVSHAAVA